MKIRPLIPSLAVSVLCIAVAVPAMLFSETGFGATLKRPNFFYEGIIGKDDRLALNATDPPFNAIGKLNVSGFSALRQCSGFLIAPNVVVTAAHCVTYGPTGQTLSPARFHFLPGWQRQKFLAHGIGKCIKVAKGFTSKRKPTLDDMAYDAALVILKDRLSVSPMELDTGAVLAPKTAIIHAGYSRDRGYLLSGDVTCSVLEERERTILTDCDTNRGASGGPVMVLGAGEKYRATAVMVGGFEGKTNVAVKLSVLQDLLKETTCD